MNLSEDTNNWVDSAERDRESVSILLTAPQIPFEIVAFHCQQCAEKYFKSILVQHQKSVPFIHDLVVLCRKAQPLCPGLAKVEAACLYLTPFGTATRYPGGPMQPTAEHMPLVSDWMDEIRAGVRNCLGLLDG